MPDLAPLIADACLSCDLGRGQIHGQEMQWPGWLQHCCCLQLLGSGLQLSHANFVQGIYLNV